MTTETIAPEKKSQSSDHVHLPLRLFLPRHVIEFLKEETARRNANADSGGDDQHWTWKQLAWVRASILLEEWANEERSKLSA